MPDPAPRCPRILAVRFSSIGDILLTTPLYRVLRTRYPECHLTVVTKTAYRPLLSDNPRIDHLLELGPGSTLRGLGKHIRAGRYTHKLDLHGGLRSRLLRLLTPGGWEGYPKHRVVRAALIATKRDLYPDETKPAAERYFDAARGLGVEPDGQGAEFFLHASARGHVDRWLNQRGLAQERPLLAIAPRARHETKCWPAERWAALAMKLTESGVDVVVVGGREDGAVCGSIADAAGPRTASAAGAFDLQQTGAVIERAVALASGDTGPMHMAAALGTPVVALFGPTVRQFGFFPYKGPATVLERDLPCRPCTKMGGPRCPLGHHRCLRDIPLEDVFAAIESWK